MAPLEAALGREGGATSRVSLPGKDCEIPVFSVPDAVLKDKKNLKGMRRADRLSKMATLAASDAWEGAGITDIDPERVGILLATGLGPHVRTFKFLDGILDFGDFSVSPTDFSHSVHNAAASYITNRIGSHGPVQTLTDFDFAFQQALRVAQCWLEERRCDIVLAGTAEELGSVLLHVCDRMLHIPPDGQVCPLAFSASPRVVPGEGAVFFALSRPGSSAPGPFITTYSELSSGSDVAIIDAGGLSGPENEYKDAANVGKLVANYVPFFGSLMTGTAFQCAIASQMIKKRIFYGNPGLRNNLDMNTCTKPQSMEVQDVNCVKKGREGRWQTVRLQKLFSPSPASPSW